MEAELLHAAFRLDAAALGAIESRDAAVLVQVIGVEPVLADQLQGAAEQVRRHGAPGEVDHRKAAAASEVWAEDAAGLRQRPLQAPCSGGIGSHGGNSAVDSTVAHRYHVPGHPGQFRHDFPFGDIERICRSLGMKPAKKGSQIWRGIGPDGRFRQTRIDSHGAGRPLASGTAKAVARQLGFHDVQEMYEYLKQL